MKHSILIIAAAGALSACGGQAQNDVAEADAAEASTANVVLPPAIAASKAYRCKDNSLVYIDWLSDGTARAKASRDELGEPVVLGEDLKGAQADAAVTYKGQSCKA